MTDETTPAEPVDPYAPVEPVEPAPAPQPAVMPPAPLALGPTISSGSRVVVMVSRGPSPTPPIAYVTVPQVVGMAQGDALARLQEAGLPSQVFNDYNDKLPRGEVIGQLPAQGASVPSGAESVLMVSSGRAAAPTIATALPNVIGLAESDAVSRI
ncbi:MAG: PASTA domain-containing protein [Coriobacteriia bacterium]